MPNTVKKIGPLAAIAVALVGITPMLPSGCTQIFTAVPAVAPSSMPTTQTAVDTVHAIGTTTATVLAATGQPFWIPIADIVFRLAALVVAWTWPPPTTKKE